VLGLGAQGFDLTGKSDLGTTHKKGRLYEASTIASKYYARDAIPSDEVLLADLEAMLAAYEHVVQSGITTSEEIDQKLALVGTWKTVKSDIDKVAEHIQHRSGWASPWSFRLKDGAVNHLQTPFTLYINGGGGQIVARARVSAVARADDSNGMTTPWPDLTDSEYSTICRFGPGTNEAIKTWFRLSAIELVSPFRATELKLAPGLSTPENLLNQNAFGYVYERDDIEAIVGSTSQEIAEVVPEVSPPDFDWLVDSTLLEPAVLEEMAQSLSSLSPQIMLAGPPGTSKTWVAKKLAEFITGGRGGAVSTVQFHPSYTYESFIEGLRPKASTSGISFELLPGAMLQLVDVMRKAGHLNDAKHPYVLIMDEANRANLPRVLGELLFLFEYRNEGIRLQYSGEFKLPSNLYFIATMNTADRSVRSIDAALRRRFDIFELGPDGEALQRYYQKTGQTLSSVVDGFVALNAALKDDIDRHHTIGHSFFMQSEMSNTRLRKIWERKIYPLLEEYFFDQPDLASDYTYQRFWSDVA
jgi:5-methylcytosine-specific restriction enzyme B